MLLTDRSLKKVLSELEVVAPYREDLVGPNSYDVTLSNVFKRLESEKDHFIRPESRTRDPYQTTFELPWREHKKPNFVLEPNEFILASTIEYVKIPKNMYAIIAGKSTLAREGIMVECAGFIDSGFEGNLTLEIKNLLPYKYRLHAGQLIAQLTFFECEEVENDYSKGHSYLKQTGTTGSKNLDKLFTYVEETRSMYGNK